MDTEFYIMDSSLQYPNELDFEQLKSKIRQFASDCEFINGSKTDKIYRNDSIFQIEVYPEITALDLLSNPKWRHIFGRDELTKIRNILVDFSKKTDISEQEVLEELLPEHSENIVHGVLCLHKIEGVDENFLVYDKNDWFKFHRHFLGLYPKNVTHYFNECIKYFPDLHFHERNEETISAIFPDFVKKIILYLGWLNDSFTDLKNEKLQRFERLKFFSTKFPFDPIPSSKKKQNYAVTLEGKADRKPLLNFEFENNKGEAIVVCCEPHMKMAFSDNFPGDSQYHQYRIYFHEGKDNIAEGKILIGHIGVHL